MTWSQQNDESVVKGPANHGRCPWREIIDLLPKHIAEQVCAARARYVRSLNNHSEWTRDQDNILMRNYEWYPGHWAALAREVNMSAQSTRERYRYLTGLRPQQPDHDARQDMHHNGSLEVHTTARLARATNEATPRVEQPPPLGALPLPSQQYQFTQHRDYLQIGPSNPVEARLAPEVLAYKRQARQKQGKQALHERRNTVRESPQLVMEQSKGPAELLGELGTMGRGAPTVTSSSFCARAAPKQVKTPVPAPAPTPAAFNAPLKPDYIVIDDKPNLKRRLEEPEESAPKRAKYDRLYDQKTGKRCLATINPVKCSFKPLGQDRAPHLQQNTACALPPHTREAARAPQPSHSLAANCKRRRNPIRSCNRNRKNKPLPIHSFKPNRQYNRSYKPSRHRARPPSQILREIFKVGAPGNSAWSRDVFARCLRKARIQNYPQPPQIREAAPTTALAPH